MGGNIGFVKKGSIAMSFFSTLNGIYMEGRKSERNISSAQEKQSSSSSSSSSSMEYHSVPIPIQITSSPFNRIAGALLPLLLGTRCSSSPSQDSASKCFEFTSDFSGDGR